jgi:uncharacterized protein
VQSPVTPKDAASVLPRKTFDCEFKNLDEGAGTFEMYALVFGNIDRQGDVIEQGAVTNVEELITDGWIAINHIQTDLPIATIETAIQDGHGLKLTGTFHSTPKAQETRTIIKERLERGKAVKTSIGYLVPVDGEHYEKQDGRTVRHITKLSVYEASYVNLPANPEAEFVSAKSLSGSDTAESEEEMSAAAVLKEVKRALGLATKGQYKVDGEDMERMKGLIDKCATASKSMAAHHKSLKADIDDHAAASAEMVKCMKNFTSGQQQTEDENNDGDDAENDNDDAKSADDEDQEEKAKARKRGKDDDEDEEGPEESRRKKRRKEDDDEGDAEEKALAAYQNELKRRALALKYPNRAG